MSGSDLSISSIGPESDFLLRNLFEHYVHDMTEWFEIDTKADGSYSYDTTSIWEDGCKVFLAKVEGAIAGFAVTSSAPDWLGVDEARDVREFFILRRYRGRGIGRNLAMHLWNEDQGEWLVRVLEANVPAVKFWRAAVASYSRGAYREEARNSNGSVWLCFRFRSE